jgi:hypothetical protein
MQNERINYSLTSTRLRREDAAIARQDRSRSSVFTGIHVSQLIDGARCGIDAQTSQADCLLRRRGHHYLGILVLRG